MTIIVLSCLVLILTVYMLKRGINVGLVMLMDSVFLAFLTKMPVTKALLSAFNGVVSNKTIELILLLFLI